MLETIWFILWGVLWAVYFMLDGFDLGLGTLLPFIAKDDRDRRVIYNAMGPFWDGNEVWLITAGGATFAAFPVAYAVMFNSLYSALLLLLFALIVRGVSFEFRNKVDSPGWRTLWDFCLFIGSFLPALLLGVAFANIFEGLPIDGNGNFQGGFFTLLNPYGIAGGVLFVVAFVVHGANWLAAKSEGEIHERAASVAKKMWPVFLVVTVLFLAYTYVATDLFDNYFKYPYLWMIPLLAVAGMLISRGSMGSGNWWRAWMGSSLAILGITFFGVAGLYPRLLPSSIDPAFSVTAFNGSSSQLTLKIMLGVALIMVPIVIAYQTWVYIFLRGKITDEELEYEEAY